MAEEEINQIIEALEELEKDMTIPRNVKLKIQKTIQILKEGSEISIKVNKALNELDEMADDANMQPYTRTQLWNIVSMLETV